MARRKVVVVEGEESAEGSADQGIATASAASEDETRAADSETSPGVDLLQHVEVVEAPSAKAPRQTRARVPRATPNEIAQTAPLIVGLANQVVVAWMGPECAMLQTEANFLTPSVARVMARLPRGAAQQVSFFTDPFIIVIALGLWATRIARIKESQTKDANKVEPVEAARAVGLSGTELTSDEPQPPTPTTAQSERANGASEAIFRTVSPT